MSPLPADEVAPDLIPDFCRWRPLLLLAFILELVAIVMTLAAGLSAGVQDRFVLTSLFLQWTGLCSAGVLCASRRYLRHLPVRAMFAISWFLLVAIAGAISAAAYEVLLRIDAQFAASPEPRLAFLFRHIMLGAVVTFLVLQYFWLQHQGRRQVLAESEARYQALQARIRPHFLFNSLNSIAALVSVRPEDAERQIEDMAELLRAGLDARSRLVPLGDELALVRAYLRIEQARLGERLQLAWDVPEDALGLDVPLLSIQPLVENAIYHGIERMAAPGRVQVAARREGAVLVVEVANPRPDPSAPVHHGQRIATDNIAQRLALLYGDGKARLDLGEEGTRYVARLTLPIVESARGAVAA